MANVFYLIIMFLQMIPLISITGGKPVMLYPLTFVVVVSMIKDISEDFKRYKSDKKENYRTVRILNTETGEFEILATVGNGADNQDKGSGKAWTYAYKCLLQKTFCLFSGEDTDNEHSDDITKKMQGEYKSASSGTTQTVGESDLISDKQSKLLFAKSKGYEVQAKEILAKHGFTSSKQITKDKFNDILADLQKVINDGI
jgi:hypothetical protein